MNSTVLFSRYASPPAEKIAKQVPSVEEIKALNAPSLVRCLKEVAPDLDEHTLMFLEKERVSGRTFLELTRDDLKYFGLELGPTKDILRIINEINSERSEDVSSITDQPIAPIHDLLEVSSSNRKTLARVIRILSEKNFEVVKYN
ncbi:unnamed protein product [Rhizophagus irregularis]|nr:hypothetical protein RhiirB3_387918 [Rhizophagus irregularis]CAB5098327.1 unnamed protein product [Rhizophagus irregularis]